MDRELKPGRIYMPRDYGLIYLQVIDWVFIKLPVFGFAMLLIYVGIKKWLS